MANPDAYVISALRYASSVTRMPYEVLYALAKAESDFNPLAKSKAGAMGLMQIMPIVVKNYDVKDPFNPSENAAAGAKLFKSYFKQVNRDWIKAIAAYNWELTNIKNNPHFRDWPLETRNHVRKVMGYARNYFAVFI